MQSAGYGGEGERVRSGFFCVGESRGFFKWEIEESRLWDDMRAGSTNAAG